MRGTCPIPCGFAACAAPKPAVGAEDVAGTTGLAGLLHRFPRQLSGGQRQRVAMGRAIIRDPKAFLFDEPLSNLDAALRVQMRKEIRGLHDRLGATSVYVTHDQIEAMTMADLIVVLRDGVIEQRGRPLDLYDFPANRFVAGFIGSPAMNFVEAAIGSDGSSLVLEGRSGERVPLDRKLEPGRKVIAGMRPENLVVAAGSDADFHVHHRHGRKHRLGEPFVVGRRDADRGPDGAHDRQAGRHDRAQDRPRSRPSVRPRDGEAHHMRSRRVHADDDRDTCLRPRPR